MNKNLSFGRYEPVLRVPSHKLSVLICIIRPWNINHANLNEKEFSSTLNIYIRVSLYRLYTPMEDVRILLKVKRYK